MLATTRKSKFFVQRSNYLARRQIRKVLLTIY
jgi:hypothetical protein